MKFDSYLSFTRQKIPLVFRNLVPSDISDEYVSGLKSNARFLINRSDDISRQWQEDYINKVIRSNRDSIFGLFANNVMIASVGVQNIRTTVIQKCVLDGTFLGVFLFHPDFRKRGFGMTAVWAGCYYLLRIVNVNLVHAGIDLQNIRSEKTFKSCGFKTILETPETIYMHCTTDGLMPPSGISNIRLDYY